MSGQENTQKGPAEVGTAGEPAPQDRFEPDHVPARGALIAVAATLLGALVAAVLVWGLFHWLAVADAPPAVPELAAKPIDPPAPPLEPTLLGNSPLVRAGAVLETERFRWLDDKHSRAQIPVERAMEILVAKGWPDPQEPAR